MKTVNVSDLTERERKSPTGKFRSFSREISIALGREDASTDLLKRHPFDLTQARIPVGASYCPYHAEGAQWEMYLVVSGRGKVRDASGEHEVKPGDAFLFKPGEAHQLSCAGEEDFVYYVIADNPIGDSCYYPDSGKWAVRKEGDETVILKGKGAETVYFDGEE